MAYAAVVSLVQILKQQILHSDEHPKPEMESLYGKVCSLQSLLDKIFPVPETRRSEVDDLEVQIRDAIYKAQDIVELHISQQKGTSVFFSEIEAKLDPIIDRAKKVGDSIGRGTIAPLGVLPEKAPASVPSSSRKSTKIVGQEQDFQLLRNKLLNKDDKLKVVAVTGLPGVGKTTLVKSIYDDIRHQFSVRAWVTASQESSVGETLMMLVREINGDEISQDFGSFITRIRQSLYERRFLIVIDDIWGKDFFERIRHAFQDDRRGSRIVMTSRDEEVAQFSDIHHVVRPLEKETSWTLLRANVFNGELCPPPLEKIGRKIAANCGGIPLAIVVVGGQLSQEEKTEEHWKSIEQDIRGAASKYQDFYSEILSLSYLNLPGELRGCFLYMGAFPEDSEIHVSKIIKLWVAEGFLPPPPPPECLEQVAIQYLKDLINRNLLSVLKFSSNGQPKTCGMQASLRKLALRECQKERFFHVLDGSAEEGTESERRISVHKNILMCIEGIPQLTESNNKLARTFLYAGPDHYHPMPFASTFDLLRVLDALSVYFIELPSALFELIHLRYLSFTCDEDLPREISQLRNLLVLIFRQNPKNMFRYASILPVEIWNLPQMRHLAFQEMDLPPPFPEGRSILFENLQSISNVNAASCTKEVLQNMPNLKKLKIWVEEPGQVNLNLDQLQHLETLIFTVLKPIPGRAVEFIPRLLFPKTLSKLSLSGCALPWEDMTEIAQLPNLEVLKLRELAFQGEEWCLDEGGRFRKLKFLLLESLDLMFWDADYHHFLKLESLIIRHCYALDEINPGIGDIGGLELVELVDCSPGAVKWAAEVRESKKYNSDLQVRIHSSWE